ncbi:PREDICTED: platelet-activating factor acetylhydrolase-like [Branchiostoma belcheri]|uniref:1-alkyl-2-acetylglycerophosphocholine esterase n=1 Tax=Branchiostoma belcheri TaxID=7741 RepID=A0A6P4Z7K6_BRABE|nr:PREDICTED: platelet-activating factor acetylhydrolase-like [Branchiostoma belcheri]XP_019637402.1 PREDICTED: platelet-activating factor acetylhydrolase-like [Branchiostoma belcheri]
MGSRLGIRAGTGPYNVGVTDIMTAGPDKHGVFLRLFYPTEPCDIRQRRHDCPTWTPSRQYLDGYLRFIAVPKWTYPLCRLIMGNPKVPAILNAPLLKQESPSKFPVIVFSHGMGGQRTTYTVVCLEMASRGYLVASIEHRDGSASATHVIRQEDDGKTPTVEWVPMIPKPEGDEFPVRNKQVHQRADEMGHMLDLLVSIDQGSNINNLCNTGMDLSQFKGKLDLDRVAAMGHSFGGATSLVSLYKDTRLKCAVILDGWMLPVDREMYPQISQPVLFINTEVFHWPGNIVRMNRLMGRDGVDRKMITIKGTVHQSQSDFTFLFGKFFGTRVQSRGALDPHVAIDINNEASLAFLAKHLDLPGNDYNSALLEGEGEHLIKGTNVKLDPRPAKEEQVDTSVEKPTPDEAKL